MYLLVIDGFGRFAEFSKHARTFRSKRKAKDYVAELHENSWDEEKKSFKEGEDWDTALLYLIERNGILTLVDKYDTMANDAGYATGWIGTGTKGSSSLATVI